MSSFHRERATAAWAPECARLRWWAVGLALLLCAPVGADTAVMVVDRADTEYPLGNHFSYYIDEQGSLTVDDVLDRAFETQLTTSTGRKFNGGFSAAAVWLVFDIRNTNGAAADWVLSLRYPLLDRIELYSAGANGTYERREFGDALPFVDRPVRARGFLLPLHLPVDETMRFAMRVTTQSSMQLEPVVYDRAHFFSASRFSEVTFGALYGAMAMMALYNLFLYFAVRDPSYLAYVASVVTSAFYSMALNGYAQEYIFPTSPLWANLVCPLMASAWVVCTALFARLFLNTQRFAPGSTVILHVLLGVGLLATALSLLASYRLAMQVASASAIASSFILIVIGVWCWIGGNRYARLFTLAWLALGGSIMLLALSRFGYLPDTFWTLHGSQVGLAAEAILLSFALSEKFRTVIREAFEITHSLDQKVDERTTHLREANAELEQASNMDSLTGIANRRRFDAYMKDEWTRHTRSGEPFALLMCDVDYFKRFNDFYGHQAGDECLQQVAAAIAQVVHRPCDLVARYGGEEFAVALPGTDLEGAKRVARDILRAVAELQIRHARSDVAKVVSMSLGATSIVPEVGQPLALLLSQADAALYRAKGDGRNRVESVKLHARPSISVPCGTWSGTSTEDFDEFDPSAAASPLSRANG